MDQATHNKIVSFIWGIADDVLRDLFKRRKYPDVILPMCVIRRMDAVLEPTKRAVLDTKQMLDEARITEQRAALCEAAGQAFYNTSKFTLRYLKSRGSVEIEPYSSGWDQEPREDVDVFFKLRAPKDSLRRVRPYPGTARGLFASPCYIRASGSPATPDDLVGHSCIGSGVWKLSRGKKVVSPSLSFHVVTGDPFVALTLAIDGLGICVLPLWLAKRQEFRSVLVPILPLRRPEPITLCALFVGLSRLTPKVKALLDFLTEYLGTRSLPLQVCVFEICQFVPKPCDKLSRIRFDSWGCWTGFPLMWRCVDLEN